MTLRSALAERGRLDDYQFSMKNNNENYQSLLFHTISRHCAKPVCFSQ